MTDYLTPEEAREHLEWCDRRNAELRAKHPEFAQHFPPVTDELFRFLMEKALLGEFRASWSLPPLESD